MQLLNEPKDVHAQSVASGHDSSGVLSLLLLRKNSLSKKTCTHSKRMHVDDISRPTRNHSKILGVCSWNPEPVDVHSFAIYATVGENFWQRCSFLKVPKSFSLFETPESSRPSSTPVFSEPQVKI